MIESEIVIYDEQVINASYEEFCRYDALPTRKRLEVMVARVMGVDENSVAVWECFYSKSLVGWVITKFSVSL